MNASLISMNDLHERFCALYARLSTGEHIAGYRAAVDAFDQMLLDDAERGIIIDFALFRGDSIVSDREAAAFVLALREA